MADQREEKGDDNLQDKSPDCDNNCVVKLFEDPQNNETEDAVFSDDKEYDLNRLTPSIEKAIKQSILSISQESSDSDSYDSENKKKKRKKRKVDNYREDQDTSLDSYIDYEILDNTSEKSSGSYEPPDKKYKFDEEHTVAYENSQQKREIINEMNKHGCKPVRVEIMKSDSGNIKYIPSATSDTDNKENLNPENTYIKQSNSDSGSNDDSIDYTSYEFLDTTASSAVSANFEETSPVNTVVEQSNINPRPEDTTSALANFMNIKVKKDPDFYLDSDEEDEDQEMNEIRNNVDAAINEFEEKFNPNIPLNPTLDHHSRGLGRQALDTLREQQALTMDRLQDLHGSLVSRPTEQVLAQDPKGLDTPLMLHQKQALAWLIWRENRKPAGGMLADDMGLGKTLSMISLVLNSLENKNDKNEIKENNRSLLKYKGGTLVVCPASLFNQWVNEIIHHCKSDALSVQVYHGANREMSIQRLAHNDIVITTYKLLAHAYSRPASNLHRIHWKRVILDEAHVIRNHKTQMCQAVCYLVADKRWALTGTPIHNKQMDLYSILKFLQCSPFDDLRVWKRWVDNRDEAGYTRLTTVMKTLLLRRTKKELIEKGQIQPLPERSFELINITLDREERAVYEKILMFSRTLFAQFLDQRAKKLHMYQVGATESRRPYGSSTHLYMEFNEAQKKLLASHADVQSHMILVLILRLRQICCHPSLIHAMLDQDAADQDGLNTSLINTDLLNQMQAFSIREKFNSMNNNNENNDEIGVTTRVSKDLLTTSNPVFDNDRTNSKVRAVLERITEILKTDDKIIIVSQWTSYLKIIAKKLDMIDGATYKTYSGTVAIKNRQSIVDAFNDPGKEPKILLLSLSVGGVGLNLVGANHIFLIDIHWNPQLELQAQDRIYRFGQRKKVFIYKFICSDTIEERIQNLQDKKLEIANNVLTGTGLVSNKLTLDDLRSLFNM